MGSDEEYEDSAWLGWPVEWIDSKVTSQGIKAGVSNPHVTALYFPNVVGLEKKGLISVLSKINFPRRYRVVKTRGTAAFGPDNDIPVLLVDGGFYTDIETTYIKLTSNLNRDNWEWARNFAFNPHITVDLSTLLNPPEEVLIRPLELWWRNDDPVPV